MRLVHVILEGTPTRILAIPFFFCLVNLATLVGVVRQRSERCRRVCDREEGGAVGAGEKLDSRQQGVSRMQPDESKHRGCSDLKVYQL